MLVRSGAVNLFSVYSTVMIGGVEHSLKDPEDLMGILSYRGYSGISPELKSWIRSGNWEVLSF